MVINLDKKQNSQKQLSLKIDNIHSLIEFQDGISSIAHRSDIAPLIDVQIVLENISAVNKISGKTIAPLLIDFSAYTTAHPLYTPTARTILFGSDSAKRRSAIAFLFSSENHLKKTFPFHASNKFNIPLKMFTNQEEAIFWLKSFILN